MPFPYAYRLPISVSCTTDGSSSSMLFEGWKTHGQGTGDSGNNFFFSIQLKKRHRVLTNLETKIKQENPDDAEDGVTNRVVLKGKGIGPTEVVREKWKQINNHKEWVFLSDHRGIVDKGYIHLRLAEISQALGIDEEDEEILSEDSGDNENDSEENKGLKVSDY